jgi:hypothetical protein
VYAFISCRCAFRSNREIELSERSGDLVGPRSQTKPTAPEPTSSETCRYSAQQNVTAMAFSARMTRKISPATKQTSLREPLPPSSSVLHEKGKNSLQFRLTISRQLIYSSLRYIFPRVVRVHSSSFLSTFRDFPCLPMLDRAHVRRTDCTMAFAKGRQRKSGKYAIVRLVRMNSHDHGSVGERWCTR